MDGVFAAVSSVADGWLAQSGTLPALAFFSEISDFLDDEIAEFADNLLTRAAKLVGAVALTVVTWWILYHGYRIASGQSRDPMMGLVAASLRAVLVIGLATGAAASAGSSYRTLADGLNVVVRGLVTGDDDGGSYADVDKALAVLQVALQTIDSVDAGDDLTANESKDRALLLAGVGLGGPAIVSATALLLNKIAMALVIGLGPVFILCLLFDQTKQFFSRWLFYGIGTLFSMAFLTVMVTLALDMVVAVGLSFWVSDLITDGQESLTSMAMQQGGLGIVLSMLIVSAPPMAAMFFQGTLGSAAGTNLYNMMAGMPTAAGGQGR